MVTRTQSEAHSLAGFRIGYAILPEPIAEALNRRNDAYPLARPSQAAAIATLQNEDQIHARAAQLLAWTEELAAQLRLGVAPIRRRPGSSWPISNHVMRLRSQAGSIAATFSSNHSMIRRSVRAIGASPRRCPQTTSASLTRCGRCCPRPSASGLAHEGLTRLLLHGRAPLQSSQKRRDECLACRCASGRSAAPP